MAEEQNPIEDGTNGAQGQQPQGDPQEGQSERTFTQEDIEKAIKDRLKNVNKKHEEELSKFANYDELLEKAAKYDEIEAQNKSELERANDAVAQATKRAEEAESEVAKLKSDMEHARLVQKVADEEGVPASLLQGADEDELREHAQALKTWANANSEPKVPKDKGGAQTPPGETLETIKAMPNGKAKMDALANYYANNKK